MNVNIRPSHVANFFLKNGFSENQRICPMKLIKLVYIGYGWIQAALDEELFDEEIQAWKHGPVIPSLYHEFKIYKDTAITKLSMELDDEDYTTEINPQIGKEQTEILFLLDFVWDVYKGFSAWTLRQMTHEDGTPWDITYNNPNRMNRVIDPGLIKKHFQVIIAEYV